MRDKTASEDLVDCRDAARFAQSDVNNHQIRATSRSGGHRVIDIVLDGGDPVTETLECFREQSADHCVVLHDQSAKRLHRTTSPPAPPSFTQTAMLLTNIDATAWSLELPETLLAAVGAIAISLRPGVILSLAAESSFRPFWWDARFDRSELIIVRSVSGQILG
jgi:hypothetical protein